MYTNKQVSLYTRALRLLFILLVFCFGSSCKKYLDKSPNQNLVVPNNLNDLQLVLDAQDVNYTPGYLELVADNYYVSSSSWNSINSQDQRLSYIWDAAAKLTQDGAFNWSTTYTAIYEANFVLDLLPSIDPTAIGNITFNSVKGSALFFRAFEFYQLAQLFCKPYSSSAGADPGIVIKLTSKISDSYSRSTVQQTYDQIISDLKSAADLLPITTLYATRPGKAAAYGALARVYLSMRDYTNAAVYADAALAINNKLLDYNSLTPASKPVLPDTYLNNPEVIMVSYGGVDLVQQPRAKIDSTLYASYAANDLRKTVFFDSYGDGTYYFKGTYYAFSSLTTPFTGIATDELYLVRAECRARANDKTGALDDLNNLLRKRWKTGTFTDLTAVDAADALAKVLVERRKELVFRGVRWTDLRRLNLETPTYTLKRIINGTTYTLPPNDPRWVLFIPETEINLSGIPQNIR